MAGVPGGNTISLPHLVAGGLTLRTGAALLAASASVLKFYKFLHIPVGELLRLGS